MKYSQHQLNEIILRDWAVRVLDADAVHRGTNVPQVQRGLRDSAGHREWTVFLSAADGERVAYTAKSPDAARLDAAEATWLGLPEAIREEIGERP